MFSMENYFIYRYISSNMVVVVVQVGQQSFSFLQSEDLPQKRWTRLRDGVSIDAGEPFVKSTYLTDLTTDVYCHYSILRNNSLLTMQPAAHDNDFMMAFSAFKCGRYFNPNFLKKNSLLFETLTYSDTKNCFNSPSKFEMHGTRSQTKAALAQKCGIIGELCRVWWLHKPCSTCICTSRMYKGEGWMQNNFTAAHPAIKWAKVQTSVVPECGLTQPRLRLPQPRHKTQDYGISRVLSRMSDNYTITEEVSECAVRAATDYVTISCRTRTFIRRRDMRVVSARILLECKIYVIQHIHGGDFIGNMYARLERNLTRALV